MSLESIARRRTESLLNERLADYSSHRNSDLEETITNRVAELATLPTTTPPRDYDELRKHAIQLQINMGLDPKPVVFIEDATEAEHFLETSGNAWSSPWRKAANSLMINAIDSLCALDNINGTKYYTHLWSTTAMAVNQILPDLGLSQYMDQKTTRRLTTTAQALIIEEEFGRPTEPYFATARQRAYIIGVGTNPSIMRIYAPK